jgi:hypothetical protein
MFARSPRPTESSRHAAARRHRTAFPWSKCDLHVLRSGQRRDQVELLKHEPEGSEPELRELSILQPGDVSTFEQDFTGRRSIDRSEQLEERRLAGSARSRYSHKLAGLDREIAVSHSIHVSAAELVGSHVSKLVHHRVFALSVPIQSTWRSASAGRSRAARRLPTPRRQALRERETNGGENEGC